MRHHVEIGLLLGLSRLRSPLTAADVKHAIRDPGKEFDWAFFLDQAVHHKVASIAAWNVNRIVAEGGRSCFDGTTAEALNACNFTAAVQDKLLTAELNEIIRAAQARSIQVVARKGAHLSPHVYRTPGLRPMGDIDLLADPKVASDLVTALAAMGYRQAKPEGDKVTELSRREKVFWRLYGSDLPMLVKETGHPAKPVVSVDINISLFLPTTGFSIPVSDLLSRALPFCDEFDNALVLAPEDVLLDLCSSIFKNSVILRFMRLGKHRRMIKYVDVLEYLSAYRDAFSWDRFLERAVGYEVQLPMFYALAHADLLFPGEIPAGPLGRLRESCQDPDVFLRQYGQFDLPNPRLWRQGFTGRFFDRSADLEIPQSRSLV